MHCAVLIALVVAGLIFK